MRYLKFLFFFLISIHFSFSWEVIDDMIAEINDGTILGRFITSKSGKPIKAFLGIPFASPPINNLRFKSPQKPQKWEGMKRTQQDAPRCVQGSYPIIQGQEDCLYLNVYVPAGNLTNVPVIFWIYGGAFSSGEASYSFYNPEYVVDHDVIVVAGNYRVGPLGFLSTEDNNAQGNFGFKDQVMILQWIQDNIHHFGGDKNSVTIWGESAGGVSVNYLMLSPLARGLFHKAISNSGTIHNNWADPWRKGEAYSNTVKLANVLSCSTVDSSAMVTCLKTKSANEIAMATSATDWSNRATIEDYSTAEPAFISSRTIPKEAADIPWLTGINSEDGLLLSASYITSEAQRNGLIAAWNSDLPRALGFDHLSSSAQSTIIRDVTQFYFGTDTLQTGFNLQNLTNLYTDVSFLGMVEALKQRFEQTSLNNTFVYLFSHKGSASFSATEEYEGTSHADDLIYLFAMHKNRYISSMPTSDDEELFSYMPMMWVEFAKNGNPRPTSPIFPQWPAASSVPFDYMQIGNENGNLPHLFELKSELYVERANFWMKLRSDHSLSRWNGASYQRIPIALIISCVFIAKLFIN